MYRPISITAVANGFCVEVGCQKFVFQSVGELVKELTFYLDDPDAAEKAMLATARNIKHTYNARASFAISTTEVGASLVFRGEGPAPTTSASQ